MGRQQDILDLLDGTYYQELDLVGRYVLIVKAVEVIKAQPEIDYHMFASQVGLTERNGQLGLTGWYMQVAGAIVERMSAARK